MKLRAAGAENFGTSPVIKPAGFCLGAQKNAAFEKYPEKEKPWGEGRGSGRGVFLFPRNANFTLYGKTSPRGGEGGGQGGTIRKYFLTVGGGGPEGTIG